MQRILFRLARRILSRNPAYASGCISWKAFRWLSVLVLLEEQTWAPFFAPPASKCRRLLHKTDWWLVRAVGLIEIKQSLRRHCKVMLPKHPAQRHGRQMDGNGRNWITLRFNKKLIQVAWHNWAHILVIRSFLLNLLLNVAGYESLPPQSVKSVYLKTAMEARSHAQPCTWTSLQSLQSKQTNTYSNISYELYIS